MDADEHVKMHGGLREETGLKTYSKGPVDYTKKLKPRFRVEDLSRPERRMMYTSGPVEDQVDAQICPRGNATEGRTHEMREGGLHKEERECVRGGDEGTTQA